MPLPVWNVIAVLSAQVAVQPQPGTSWLTGFGAGLTKVEEDVRHVDAFQGDHRCAWLGDHTSLCGAVLWGGVCGLQCSEHPGGNSCFPGTKAVQGWLAGPESWSGTNLSC